MIDRFSILQDLKAQKDILLLRYLNNMEFFTLFFKFHGFMDSHNLANSICILGCCFRFPRTFK